MSITIRGNALLAPPDGCFVATYNTTTYAEVVRAYLNGQNILVKKQTYSNTYYYILVRLDINTVESVTNYEFRFSHTNDTGFDSDPILPTYMGPKYTSLKLTSSGWETGYDMNIEITDYKVTSLSSDSSDYEYPSAKCVYDAIYGIETALSQL